MAVKRNTVYTPGSETTSKGWAQQSTVPFNGICEQGTYYFHPTGMLFRVPPEAVSPGHSPMINICWTDECYCTKISDDPYVPLNKARQICANWDLAVYF